MANLEIKICGNRRRQDIEYLNCYKPDYAGFILSSGFKRSITYGTFYEIISYLDKDIKKVGVFVNEPIDNIPKAYFEELDVIQLHGNENEQYISQLKKYFNGEVWKAVRAKSPEDIEMADKLPGDKLLIDSYVKGVVGGSGVVADFDVINKAKITKPFFLAGGLDSLNINSAIEQIKQDNLFGVDISSGVETDGFKDGHKIKDTITILRRCFYE